MRGATVILWLMVKSYLFQSTRPMRGATGFQHEPDLAVEISIHAPHAGRDGYSRHDAHDHEISIHAPHAGRDLVDVRGMSFAGNFNPRAPCGARRGYRTPEYNAKVFQSTRPMRGATRDLGQLGQQQRISIHAPHAGRDMAGDMDLLFSYRFQSTRPMRGAT